jgi:hypothetical protein
MSDQESVLVNDCTFCFITKNHESEPVYNDSCEKRYLFYKHCTNVTKCQSCYDNYFGKCLYCTADLDEKTKCNGVSNEVFDNMVCVDCCCCGCEDAPKDVRYNDIYDDGNTDDAHGLVLSNDNDLDDSDMLDSRVTDSDLTELELE